MVEMANNTTAIVKKGPENEIYLENAAAVIAAPSTCCPAMVTIPPSPRIGKQYCRH